MKKALLAVCLSVTACSSSSGISASDIACPTPNTLTYANFAQALVSSSCLSCHAGKDRPTLTTQAALLANKAAILDQAVYNTSMPESGTLSHDQRVQLGQWLSCGAP